MSQTVFQGFSCRQLDENEEWLDVDFQISCTSDSYLAFVSLGFVGVLVYQLGVPPCALPPLSAKPPLRPLAIAVMYV